MAACLYVCMYVCLHVRICRNMCMHYVHGCGVRVLRRNCVYCFFLNGVELCAGISQCCLMRD